jgi:hypothetical protein
VLEDSDANYFVGSGTCVVIKIRIPHLVVENLKVQNLLLETNYKYNLRRYENMTQALTLLVYC